jgi:hypothetical protein
VRRAVTCCASSAVMHAAVGSAGSDTLTGSGRSGSNGTSACLPQENLYKILYTPFCPFSFVIYGVIRFALP